MLLVPPKVRLPTTMSLVMLVPGQKFNTVLGERVKLLLRVSVLLMSVTGPLLITLVLAVVAGALAKTNEFP